MKGHTSYTAFLKNDFGVDSAQAGRADGNRGVVELVGPNSGDHVSAPDSCARWPTAATVEPTPKSTIILDRAGGARDRPPT